MAVHLKKARKAKGWSQERAGKELAWHLGEEWSKARWSQAEQIADPATARGFTANELVAFSLTFERPVIWFLMPPPPEDEFELPLPSHVGPAAAGGIPLHEYLDLLYVADLGLAGMAERVEALSDFLSWDLRERMRAHQTPIAARAIKDVAGDLFDLYGDMRRVAMKLEEMSD